MGAKRSRRKHPGKDRRQGDRHQEPPRQHYVPANRRNFLPVLIIFAGVAAYFNSFSGVFLFDDTNHILGNERIRHLWPVWDLLACRRPVVELSLAFNYALGEYDVWGYHLFNLTVHILAALTLYAIVRRTLTREVLRDCFGPASSWLALTVALIWVVHPLQTQSVDYLIQRGESLMGLFYLLTLYCVIRSADSSRRHWWYAAAVVAGVLGMGSKAVMVTAPVVVLLYDRAFLCKSFAEAIRRRWALYTGLTATWFILVLCGVVQGVLDPSRKFATVGFSFKGLTPLQYALSQPGAILQYLRLTLWPHPLCLDYGSVAAWTNKAVVGPVIAVTVMLAATVWASVRRPWRGFVGAWFFLILAPTSSFIPIKDLIFEHRMYLSLAGVVALVVVGGHTVLKRLFADRPLRHVIATTLVVAVVAVLGYGTIQRNYDYHSLVVMWNDVLAKHPDNARAHYNLGNALSQEKRLDEAVEAYRAAIRLSARYAKAHSNLGLVLTMQGKLAEATKHLRHAIRIKPTFAEAHQNLGNVLRQQGRHAEAIQAYREALRHSPNLPEAYSNLGVVLAELGRFEEGIRASREAVRLRPDFPEACMNLGVTLNKAGNLDEAAEAYRKTLQLNPQYPEAHANLGLLLARQGKLDEAMEEYRASLEIRPDYPQAHHHIGFVLLNQGRVDEAIEEFRTALRINPRYAEASYKLGNALAQLGRFEEAINAYRNAISMAPMHAQAHAMLGIALARSGRHVKAVEEFRAAIRIRPAEARWHANLGNALAAQGLVDEAVVEFKEALRIDPQLDRTQQALDTLLSKRGVSSTP